MIINASIQIVPLTTREEAYALIDRAIGLIQQSGLKHTIGAFETTIEGEYETVQQLLRKLQDACNAEKHLQFLVYTKLHLCGGEDILVENKISKFRQDTDFTL